MGNVHRATLREGGAEVAIKVLRKDLAENPDVVARFVGERQALKATNHPNVVKVHDLIVDDDLGIVMEYIAGGTLADSLARHENGAAAALRLGAAIASGLAAVHRSGVAHRDLKPANILCYRTADGIVPKLTDFGVARLISKATTMTSQVIGTPTYMAPEQAVKKPDDPGDRHAQALAGDVYSFGAVLFEMLTGRPPYEEDNAVALVMAHTQAPIPTVEGAPDGVSDLLTRMMAKEWRDRPTDLDEIASLLEGFGGQVTPGARPTAGDTTGTVLEPTPSPETPVDGTIIRPREEAGHLIPDPPAPSPDPSDVTGAKAGHDEGGRDRRKLLIAAVVAVIALIAGLFAFPPGGDGESEVEAVSPEYAFAPSRVGDAGIATRNYQFTSVEGDEVSVTVTIVNDGDEPLTAEHLEIIPKSIAEHVDDITFDPEPDEIVDPDPKVLFFITDLQPGGSFIITYSAAVEALGDDLARLEAFADDQRDAEADHRAETGEPEPEALISELAISADSTVLEVGNEIVLVLSGTTTEGEPADDTLLTGISWSSSAEDIAAVDSTGKVKAIRAGTVEIMVQSGDITATIALTVETPPEDDDDGSELADDATTTTEQVTTTVAPTTTQAGATTTTSTTSTTTTTTLPDPDPPSRVTGVSASAGNEEATVDWSAPGTNGAPITEYQVRSSSGSTQNASGSTTSLNFTGLTNGSSYSFQVRARNTAGWGPWSNSSTSVTPSSVPLAPAAPGATRGSAEVALTWAAPDDGGLPITEYRIESDIAAGEKVDGGSPYTWTGLTNGTAYSFRVRACNANGCGSWSPWSAAATPSTIPGVPGIGSASRGNASASVSWSAPASNGGSPLTTYEIDSDVAPGTNSTLSSPYSWTGLSNGTAYRFRVRACNVNGCSAYSGWTSAVTPSTTPATVGKPSVSAGNARVTVSWSTPNDGGASLTGYEIDSDNASGTRSDGASPYAWTGLSNGTSYRFRVRACNTNGCGSWSSWSNAATPVAPRVISLTRGSPINGGYWYNVSLSGFTPNSSVTVACHDSVDSNFWTQSISINGSGNGGDSTLCWSADGPSHWVTGGGVTSNTVNW